MRILLTCGLLTLSCLVLLTTGEHLPRMVAACLGVIATRELHHGWLARRARKLELPRFLVAGDIAPHLRALRDEVQNELRRADVLNARMTPRQARAAATAGLQADLALKEYSEAHLTLVSLVEHAEGPRPLPLPPPTPRRVRSEFDEHTMPTREVA